MKDVSAVLDKNGAAYVVVTQDVACRIGNHVAESLEAATKLFEGIKKEGLLLAYLVKLDASGVDVQRMFIGFERPIEDLVLTDD